MFWDNRGFVHPDAEVTKEFKTPDLRDKNDVNLARAMAQEHTSMLKRVKKEERDRIYHDGLLEDEMHSFGLVTCDVSDEALHCFDITLKTKAGANMWVYKIPIAGGAIASGNWGATIDAGTTIHFTKNSTWADGTRTFLAIHDKYKVRCDLNTDDEFTFYIGTDGFMTDGSNLVSTTGRVGQEIELNGTVVCYK